MQREFIPDVFELPETGASKRPWLAALALTAIVIAGTLVLIASGEVASTDPMVTVER